MHRRVRLVLILLDLENNVGNLSIKQSLIIVIEGYLAILSDSHFLNRILRRLNGDLLGFFRDFLFGDDFAFLGGGVLVIFSVFLGRSH